MTGFSFIHAADLHLDAPFRGLGLLPENEGFAPQRALRQAGFLALERLTGLCIASGADFLLLAGDVYNSADSSLRARLALRDAFVRLETAGIGVFLAHGNHDPLRDEGGYQGGNGQAGSGQAAVPWPDNVHVFGPEVGCRIAFARGGGAPVALVHGVSHSGPAETRNLAATFKRKTPSLLEPDLFQIGLLHCALAGVSGGHDAYAPCTFTDLAEAELDYWALGHVHACRLFDRRGKTLPSPMPDPAGGDEPGGRPHNQQDDRPDNRHDGGQDNKPGRAGVVAAYSGSLQGLHVNESGPHGCLLVRVDAKGRALTQGLRIAPVQWESLRLEPGPDVAALPALESFILERAEALAPQQPGRETPEEGGFAPESLAVRIVLAGQSPLHAELAAPDAAEDLRLRLGRDLAARRVWVRDLAVRLAPVLDREAALLRPDLAGEVLRLAESLGHDGLSPTLAAALDPLFNRARLRKDIDPPEADELAALVDEAALLCLDLLGPEQDEAEEA